MVQRRPRDGRPPRRLHAGHQRRPQRRLRPAARSPPSTPRPTSIASCWRPCRSTRATPRRCRELYVPRTGRRAGAAERGGQASSAAPRRLPSVTRTSSPSVTISFNLAPGARSATRSRRSRRRSETIGMPSLGHGQLLGRCRRVHQARSRGQPWLILARRHHDLHRAGRAATRASSTRSRFSPRCRRPASARCWR